MSEPENFVTRWSRLKRRSAEQTEESKSPGAAPHEESRTAPAPIAADPQEARELSEPEFDLSSLPSLEEITAHSDVSAFLQSGVPAELAKAALRRAWTSDPAIRDFVGLAENQWDFTDPASIPGFGPIGDADVNDLVARAMGTFEEIDDAGEQRQAAVEAQPHAGEGAEADIERQQASTAAAPSEKSDAEDAEPTIEQSQTPESAATQHVNSSTESASIPNRRGHGGALPR